MNQFKTDKQCYKASKNGWLCNLPQGHGGDVHVAIGISNKVIEVWSAKIVTEEKEEILFLKEPM